MALTVAFIENCIYFFSNFTLMKVIYWKLVHFYCSRFHIDFHYLYYNLISFKAIL